jgi:hypothetical protein
MNAPEAPVERKHALLSASSANRWLACPPSARLEEQIPNSTNAYAEEGTFAHAVAEIDLARYLGRIDREDYRAAWSRFLEDPRATPEFCLAVEAYVQFGIERIEAARRRTPDAVVLLEQRLDYSHVAPEGFGTGDLVLIYDGVIEVIDLKFGQGLTVSPVRNPQAMLYGLGALPLNDLLYGIHTVRLTIHQPRVGEGKPQTWELPADELLQWAAEIKPVAQLAFRGEGNYQPGEHCRFCRAAATCRARAEYYLNLTRYEFRDPPLLADSEVAEILDKLDGLLAWAGQVREHARTGAQEGRKFPGWKLVRGRSVRTYGDPDQVAAALAAGGIPAALIFERRLLGITALEKVIGKAQFQALLPEPLVTKPPGALVLAPARDPRPEVESSALEGFETVSPQPGEPTCPR